MNKIAYLTEVIKIYQESIAKENSPFGPAEHQLITTFIDTLQQLLKEIEKDEETI